MQRPGSTAGSHFIAIQRDRLYRWLGATWANILPDGEVLNPLDSDPKARRTPDLFQLVVAFFALWLALMVTSLAFECNFATSCSSSFVVTVQWYLAYIFGPVGIALLICFAIRRIWSWNDELEVSRFGDVLRVVWGLCLIALAVYSVFGVVPAGLLVVLALLGLLLLVLGVAHTVLIALLGVAVGTVLTDIVIWRATCDADGAESTRPFLGALRAARRSFIILTIGLAVIAVLIQVLPLPAMQGLVVAANEATHLVEHWLSVTAWLIVLTLAGAAVIENGAAAAPLARVFRTGITVRGWFSRAFAFVTLLAGIALSVDAVYGDAHDRVVDLTLREQKQERDADRSRAAALERPRRAATWSSRDEKALATLAQDFVLALGSSPALRQAQDAAWDAVHATVRGPAPPSNVSAGLARIHVGDPPARLIQRIETRLRDDIARRFPRTWSALRQHTGHMGANPNELRALLLDQFLELALDKSIKFDNGLRGDVAGAAVTDISKSSLTTALDRAYDRFTGRLLSPKPDPATFALPLDIPMTRSEQQFTDVALGTLASVKAQAVPHSPSAIELREVETSEAITVGRTRAAVADGADLAIAGMSERIRLTTAATRTNAELFVDAFRFLSRVPK